MNFVFKTRNCVFKTRNFALKMMDFAKAAGALGSDRKTRSLVDRFMLLRRNGNSPELFTGTGDATPVRSQEQRAADQAKATRQCEKKVDKKEKEGMEGPGQNYLLPWEKQPK